MILTSQYTEDYAHKAVALEKSIQDMPYMLARFNPIVLKSYRTTWPTNRKSFATAQCGEFLDFFGFDKLDDEEIIICVDADSVMNRPFTTEELSVIESMLEKYDVLSVYGAYPPTPLINVLENLDADPKQTERWHCEVEWYDRGEFTTSFLIAKKKNFARLRKWYLHYFDKMTELTGHHAGCQWLANWIVVTKMSVGILGKQYQCGSWYDGCTEKDAQEAVFNHTK